MFFISILLEHYLYTQDLPYKALVIVPVADLVTVPLSLHYEDVEQAYKNIPISWGHLHIDKMTCARQHQALYNETVLVVAQTGKEVCIKISNAFSENVLTNTAETTYWTLSKNVCPLTIIPQKAQYYIPPPISYCDKDLYQANVHIITLVWPLYDATTRKRYSAGTRFVYLGCENENYVSYLFDYQMHSIRKIIIPKKYAMAGAPTKIQSRIELFVSLLQQWAQTSYGFIPFVWGGTSFTKYVTMEGFSLTHKDIAQEQEKNYWQLHEDANVPYTGFDASGLVLRAAQICGIPYFFKNTTTALRHILSIQSEETIEKGDLFWFPGGLLVVSDIKNNKIIGAFGYQFGFGKIIEQNLSDIFQKITTYHDLVQAYKNRLPLELKKHAGTKKYTITKYTILKLASLWKNKPTMA